MRWIFFLLLTKYLSVLLLHFAVKKRKRKSEHLYFVVSVDRKKTLTETSILKRFPR